MNNRNVLAFPVPPGDFPFIPTGVYQVAYARHLHRAIYRRPQIYVLFSVVTPGPAFRVMLPRYYSVNSVHGKRAVTASVGRGSDLYRDLCRVGRQPRDPKRVDPASFADLILDVQVVTVSSDREQRELPEGARYSKVGRIIEVSAGR